MKNPSICAIIFSMLSYLVPREGVYELYWQFAAKRQEAFVKRINNEPRPWSDDPILNDYKFCNVFRAADRVSQYMIKDVCYKEDGRATKADRIFQITAFRTFSNINTWESVKKYLGHAPYIDDLVTGAFRDALDAAKVQNGTIYTGAFILCASDAYKKPSKHWNHVALFRDMFVDHRLADHIVAARSLREVFDLLHAFPLMGDFMSYQTAIDLNYSEFVNYSENEFTVAGPGALRGIKKCFLYTGSYTPSEIIMWMVDHQEEEFSRLGLKFDGLWGRKLHAIDCQGLFCETDKYCRQAVPELASARKRIKSRFNVSTKPMRLFFPPKWGINDRLPNRDVLGNGIPA